MKKGKNLSLGDEPPTQEDLDATLVQMVAEGLATVETGEDGLDYYELTPKGIKYCEENFKDMKDDE